MNPPTRPKRPHRLGALVLVFGVVAVIGAIAGAVGAMMGGLNGALGLALTAASISVAMVLALALTVWWWRGIDEAAREAHKWAWWWGGSAGLAIGAILLATLTARDDLIPVETLNVSAADLVAGGMWTILLFQLAGYSLAWAVWWLRRR